MSKQIALIGDCHSSQLIKYNILGENKIIIWSKGGLRLNYMHNNAYIGFNPSYLFKINKQSDGVPQFFESKIILNDPYCKINFAQIKNEGVIIFWIGYVDIKNYLPIEKNSYNTIELSIKNIKKHYNKAKIYFIEPLPQSKQFIFPENENWKINSFEDRLEQNNLFISNLNKLAKKYDIEILISQKEIKQKFKINDQSVDNIFSKEKDFLFDTYYEDIYKLIIEKLKKYDS